MSTSAPVPVQQALAPRDPLAGPGQPYVVGRVGVGAGGRRPAARRRDPAPTGERGRA